MAGLYFEQFEVGQRFEHLVRRTVTETDNLLFSALTMNPAALHLDAEYCKGTPFGQRIVNSVFTLGLLVGLSVYDTTYGTTVGNLGWEEVRFPAPGADRRHAARRDHRAVQAREPVAPGFRHRDVRAPRLQPARRGGGFLPPRRADAEEAGRVSHGAPLRSLLFVPGDSERKQAKALASAADALILDLEDSVDAGAAAGRAAARARAAEPRAAPQRAAAVGAREPAVVRGLLREDLQALFAAAPACPQAWCCRRSPRLPRWSRLAGELGGARGAPWHRRRARRGSW